MEKSQKNLFSLAVAVCLLAVLSPALHGAEVPGDSISLSDTRWIHDNAAAPLISQLNPIIRLYPDKAVERSGDIRFGKGELRVMLPFFGSGEVVWNVTVPESGSYELSLCYSCTIAGTPLKISAGKSEVQHVTQVTKGFFLPDPKGASGDPGDPDSPRSGPCVSTIPSRECRCRDRCGWSPACERHQATGHRVQGQGNLPSALVGAHARFKA